MGEQETEVELESLRKDVETLSKEVEALRSDIRDLLDAWRTANGLLSVIKVIGAISAAVLGVIALAKGVPTK